MTEEEIKKDDIVKGEVTNITKFGVFVKLPNGQEGLVHISEVAYEYVTDISEYTKVGDEVEVKVLGINADKKYELSIKQTKPKENIKKDFYKPTKDEDFEKRLVTFLKRSEEKQIDIRRNLKEKQKIKKKRK
ncbi:S1 RNA-binding domain-containing protein [Candidatus Margulisiibacteriota bacterium]